MASPPDFAALPYPQRLEAILRAPQLPNGIDLGEYKWDSERREWQEQEGFVCMTTEQSLQLARQLQQHNNVTHLNLRGTCLHDCGCCGACDVG